DAVLFDMDGTLTDSIAAVEAAWGKVAQDIGQDPSHVIASTHGKRAIDNLAQFKPHLKAHEMDDAVTEFEETILYYADAFHRHRSVRILPGIRKLLDSIPEGRYAVATSGAKTYAYGCMTRVGITPPKVTITADDKRLKAGKPAPDPFLLAAECLGFDPKSCVVVEDSPSGIRAGVASGAIVIAVCTSHEREAIADCGAHYVVEDMEKV
ncbi:hypothetical protein HETIRDRAFT_16177, partial [Heterobasidion irregulare TC 32-1]